MRAPANGSQRFGVVALSDVFFFLVRLAEFSRTSAEVALRGVSSGEEGGLGLTALW